MSILGCFCWGPLAYIFPGLFSYKIFSKTWKAKAIDIFLIAYGIGVIIFCTITTLI